MYALQKPRVPNKPHYPARLETNYHSCICLNKVFT